MNTRETARARPDNSQLLLQGAIGGLIAGIVFAMAEMMMNVMLGRPFFGPLRLIASLALGSEATQPTFPLLNVAIVGVLIHMIFPVVYGVIFIYLLALLGQLDALDGAIVLYGTIFGLLLWVVNFLLIAPVAFPQITQVNQLWNGFVAHTFFYGTVLGAYVAWMNERLLLGA